MAAIKFQFIANDAIYFILLYVITRNVVQLINFPSQVHFSPSVTKRQHGRLTRVRVARYSTAVAAWGIIYWLLIFLILCRSMRMILLLNRFNKILFWFFRAFICFCIFSSVFQNYLIAASRLARRTSKSLLIFSESNVFHPSLEWYFCLLSGYPKLLYRTQ